ncbi:hypothetical protein E1A91_A13G111100v1, partial [Gossypium mustelinum]
VKFLCWNCRGLGNPATIRELKQLLVSHNPDIIFLSKKRMKANNFQRVRNRCRMQNGLDMSAEGRSGGPALTWKEGVDVNIQNYSKYHIDALVRYENNKSVRFTGFYGDANPSLRNSSWNMVRRIGGMVGKDWIVGGDFNAILNDAEKEGGCRKARSQINEFKDLVDELALINIKPDKGWFTWVNNRDRNTMIKEILDRFLTSVPVTENFPFLATYVVRQTNSEHDVIVLDTWGCKPKMHNIYPRLSFKYDICWVTDVEAKNIIKGTWQCNDNNFMDKLNNMCLSLGLWKRGHFNKMKKDIRRLENKIDRIIESPQGIHSTIVLKETQSKLNHINAKEEKYWSQRSRSL